MKKTSSALLATAIFFAAGCAVAPPRLPPSAPAISPAPPPIPKSSALVRLLPEGFPLFEDDSDTSSLRTAALQSAAYYRALPPDQLFTLASDTYTAQDLALTMDAFVDLLDHTRTPAERSLELKSHFLVYQSVGVDDKRTVTFSSYYEPTIHARLQPGKLYRYPIYSRPDDLIDVNLGLFDSSRDGARLSGRREGRGLVPYYTRGDIDSHKVLGQKALEIAWAKDPLDIFFLQVEGSGWLDLGKRHLVRIRYDGDNGKPYKSVGQYLIATGRVRAKGFGHKEFQRYMRRHPKERQDLLNVDERYIFFHIDISTTSPFAYGNIDVPLTPNRSIATDPKLFPKGGLAWIEIETANRHMSRFMLNQDEGGAIQGPGRVDFFAGHGRQAERFATHLWHPGKLYFLVKKRS